jgi:hypothetical protein
MVHLRSWSLGVAQDEGNTNTENGRARLVDAVTAAREALGHKTVADDDLRVLLFGSGSCVETY